MRLDERHEKSVGFEDLLLQLRAVNVLLAKMLTKSGDAKQLDLILLLAKAGLPSTEIARILATTANTVQVALSRNRKRVRAEPLRAKLLT